MAAERAHAGSGAPAVGGVGPPRHSPLSIAAVVLAAGISVSAIGGAVMLLGGGGGGGGFAGSPTPTTTDVPATTGTPTTPDATTTDHPSASTSTPAPSDSQSPGPLDQFLADCERRLENWRPGQVSYPRQLAVPLDRSGTYRAVIDIRPGAQAQPPPGPGTETQNIQVQCGVGARLVPLGNGITVDETDWILREFDTPGTVEWSWSIMATRLEDAEVRLDLRPAIAVVRGGYVIPADEDSRSPTAAFTSTVTVTGDWTDHLADWFDRDWPVITGAFVLVGAAVAGVLSWLVKQRRALRELRGAAPTRTGSTPAPSPRPRPPAPRRASRLRPSPPRRRSRPPPPVDQRQPPGG